MFIKAVTSDGFYDIYDNVYDVKMGLSEVFYQSPESTYVDHIKMAIGSTLIKVFGEDMGGWLFQNARFIFIPNKSPSLKEGEVPRGIVSTAHSCRMIKFTQSRGNVEFITVLLSENRLFLCNDDGTTMAKW